MKTIKKALLITAMALSGGVMIFAITQIYSTWQNKYRSPDKPLYPTELVYKNAKGNNMRLDVYRPNNTAAIHKPLSTYTAALGLAAQNARCKTNTDTM